MGANFECVIRFASFAHRDFKEVIEIVEAKLAVKPAPKNTLNIYGDDPVVPVEIYGPEDYKSFFEGQISNSVRSVIANYNVNLPGIQGEERLSVSLECEHNALEFAVDEEYIFGSPSKSKPFASIGLHALFEVLREVSEICPTVGACMGTEGGPAEGILLSDVRCLKPPGVVFSKNAVEKTIAEYWSR